MRKRTFQWPRIALPSGLAVAGAVIGLLFVGPAAAMAIMFGLSLGPGLIGITGAAVGLGAMLFNAAYLSATLGRGRWLAALVGLPLFLLTMGYALEAGHHFAAENFGKREAGASAQADAFATARDRLKALKDRRAAIAEPRPVAEIEADIAKLLRDPLTDNCEGKHNGVVTKAVCPKVDELRAAKARAEERDRLDRDIIAAGVDLGNAAPAAATAGSDYKGGPAANILRALGFSVESFEHLVAVIVTLMVEIGAPLAPLVFTLAAAPGVAGRPGVQASSGLSRLRGDAAEAGIVQTYPRLSGKRVDRVAEDIDRFLKARTRRVKSASTQASDLYKNYVTFKLISGEEPVKPQYFGDVMSRYFEVPKEKRSGCNWYLGLEILETVELAKASQAPRLVANAPRGK